MQSEKTLKKHADLVDRMATALGVDLEESILRGRIEIDDISDAVLSCTACSAPEHCAGWLEKKGGDRVTSTPEYCRNKALLERLQGLSG